MLNRRSFFRHAAAALGAVAASGVIAKQTEAAPKLIHGEVLSTSETLSTAGLVATSGYARVGDVQDFGSGTLTVTNGLPGPMQQIEQLPHGWVVVDCGTVVLAPVDESGNSYFKIRDKSFTSGAIPQMQVGRRRS